MALSVSGRTVSLFAQGRRGMKNGQRMDKLREADHIVRRLVKLLEDPVDDEGVGSRLRVEQRKRQLILVDPVVLRICIHTLLSILTTTGDLAPVRGKPQAHTCCGSGCPVHMHTNIFNTLATTRHLARAFQLNSASACSFL